MLSHLILGFLRDGQARHGYELITEYKTRSGNQVSAGNFYRELARMAAERLVQTGVNPPDADARRIPYQITERGRQSFDEWLLSPSRDENDLAAWLLFIDRVPTETRDRLLDRWQDDLWLRSKSLSRAREDALLLQQSRQDAARYDPLASLISRRLKQVTADIEFLKEFRTELIAWTAARQRAAATVNCVRDRSLGKGVTAQMTDAIIRLTGISKSYGTGEQAAIALDRIDLDVARGEFVSLMGPSGSGKTTLLNVVAGLDVPDSGSVLLDGVDLSTLADHQLADLRLQKLGFIFQSFNLIPALTVDENVSWPLEFAGHSRAEVRRRVTDALHRAGVVGRGARYPGELSGGEQQRVAIARAIATGPSILLADEPTGNLDSLTGQKILDLLRGLNESEGVTVLMVTHNVLAATYGDRTLEVQDGRIIRDVRTPPTVRGARAAAEER